MKDMIFEADRKTARQGDSVELRWDADMPDSLSVIIDFKGNKIRVRKFRAPIVVCYLSPDFRVA